MFGEPIWKIILDFYIIWILGIFSNKIFSKQQENVKHCAFIRFYLYSLLYQWHFRNAGNRKNIWLLYSMATNCLDYRHGS